MQKKLQSKLEGFTIIEVLIVLAIAGLIMLIVFLAVPALQRNSRNTQRNNDAALIGGAINECLNNRNGQTGSCDTNGEVEAISLDPTKIQQLTNYTIGSATPSMPAAGDLNHANIGYNARCSADGASVEAGSDREAVIAYRIEIAGSEDGVERCLQI